MFSSLGEICRGRPEKSSYCLSISSLGFYFERCGLNSLPLNRCFIVKGVSGSHMVCVGWLDVSVWRRWHREVNPAPAATVRTPLEILLVWTAAANRAVTERQAPSAGRSAAEQTAAGQWTVSRVQWTGWSVGHSRRSALLFVIKTPWSCGISTFRLWGQLSYAKLASSIIGHGFVSVAGYS